MLTLHMSVPMCTDALFLLPKNTHSICLFFHDKHRRTSSQDLHVCREPAAIVSVLMAQHEVGRPPPSAALRLVCQVVSLFLFLFFLKDRFYTTEGFSRLQKYNPAEIEGLGFHPSYPNPYTLVHQRSLLSFNGGELVPSIDVHKDVATLNLHGPQSGEVQTSFIRDRGAVYLMQAGSYQTLAQNGSLMMEALIIQASNSSSDGTEHSAEGLPCDGVTKHIGFPTACDYVKAIPQCKSASVIDYTRFFFCTCGKFPIIGYMVLTLWLLILFYTLGNTAADYFCCSLEKLSKLLNCPPTVAGVTLLPLGNGAPDVFASIAAFIGAGVGQVGLNSVLGGGVFVTTVVAGLVSLSLTNAQPVELDKRSFIRDVCFYLFTILSLAVILLVGHVYLWSALAFLSIYGLYAIAVAASEILRKRPKRPQWSQIQLLPFTSGPSVLEEEDDSLHSPLLDTTPLPTIQGGVGRKSLPQWRWASNVAIYSQQSLAKRGESPRPLWGWGEDQEAQGWLAAGSMFVYLLQWPLSLPRRLTIPVVEEDRWSRVFALASAGLAPVFFAVVLDSQEESTFGANKAMYIGAVFVGISLATLAFFSTKPESPPRRFLFPWVVGGFFMSIVWFFVIANELVALLVTFGTMLEIDPSILGLTVLAWGNSMGDLMANISLACNGGDGVQIAISGCYAGPMFNTLIGLGISLVLGSWGSRPHAFLVPRDDSIYFTMAFLVIGLLWSLITLPLKKMQPSKLLGFGLLTLYVTFLGFRLGHALGFVPVSGW